MKVIVAGLSKTGTKSMNAALTKLGYKVYDSTENIFLLRYEYKKIYNEGWTTEDFRKMYEEVDAVVDIPACYFWDEIHKAFPDAKIILTVRDDEDQWFQSMHSQMRVANRLIFKFMPYLSPTNRAFNREFLEKASMLTYGIPPQHTFRRTPNLNEQLSKKMYRAHNAYVMQTAPKDKLLVFKCSEGWEPLCTFLGKPVPDEPFPHKNIKAKMVDEIKVIPEMLKIRREMMLSLLLILSGTSVIGYCSYRHGPLGFMRLVYNHTVGHLSSILSFLQ